MSSGTNKIAPTVLLVNHRLADDDYRAILIEVNTANHPAFTGIDRRARGVILY